MDGRNKSRPMMMMMIMGAQLNSPESGTTCNEESTFVQLTNSVMLYGVSVSYCKVNDDDVNVTIFSNEQATQNSPDNE